MLTTLAFACFVENIPGRLSLKPQTELERGTELVCQITTKTARINQARFKITWYTVDAAGMEEPFHNEIVQANSNGTIISRLQSRCNRPGEVNGCYSGKKSFKVRS